MKNNPTDRTLFKFLKELNNHKCLNNYIEKFKPYVSLKKWLLHSYTRINSKCQNHQCVQGVKKQLKT